MIYYSIIEYNDYNMIFMAPLAQTVILIITILLIIMTVILIIIIIVIIIVIIIKTIVIIIFHNVFVASSRPPSPTWQAPGTVHLSLHGIFVKVLSYHKLLTSLLRLILNLHSSLICKVPTWQAPGTDIMPLCIIHSSKAGNIPLITDYYYYYYYYY